MKKIFFIIISFVFGFVPSFSQLKVFDDGTVRLASSPSGFPSSLVQIGDTVVPPSAYKFGLTSSINSSSFFCGASVKGVAVVPSNIIGYIPIGVWGEAGDGLFESYGVVGQVTGTQKGAGVYGMDSSAPLLPIISGQYAGLFNGETKVLGDFTATNVYTSSDVRLKDNISDISEGESATSLDKLMNVNVIKYNLKEEAFGSDSCNKSEKVEKATSLVHFGVSAQELQEIYPNLVKDGQDGYLAVNYTELVPVLIRSIQELKQELDEMKGGGDSRQTRSVSFGDSEIKTSAKNVLYQNTPNPFKELTTIRFSLADETKDAAICIFDLTGKLLKRVAVSSSVGSISVNSWELGEGMFLYTLMVNGCEVDTKRMIITK